MNESFTGAVVRLSTTDDGSLLAAINETSSYRIARVDNNDQTIFASDIENERVFEDVDCEIKYSGGLGAEPVRTLQISN